MKRLAALMVSLLVALPLPAQASSPIGLSRDGATWDSTLVTPLFDSAERWVPGDTRTETFYVRNQSSDEALLKLTIASIESDPLWVSGELDLSMRVDGATWVALDSGMSTPASVLSPGDDVRVDIRADYEPTGTNQSQTRDLDFTVTALLTEYVDQGVADESADDDDDSGVESGSEEASDNGDTDGSLPATGGTTSARQALSSVILLAAGSILVAFARRRHDEEESETRHV